MIQSHLKKLFAGIHNVGFDEGCKTIVAMKSLDGEVVSLKKPVTITPEVEVSNLTVLSHVECTGLSVRVSCQLGLVSLWFSMC